MSDFYPFVGVASDYEFGVSKELPLLKEFQWDFETNNFIVDENGNFKVVEGKKALEVWIYKTLLTNRYEHEIYSWDYGTELIKLVGQKFTRGLTESEAFRFVKEALMINPYINDVINKGVSFIDDTVNISIYVDSVYGEVEIDVSK